MSVHCCHLPCLSPYRLVLLLLLTASRRIIIFVLYLLLLGGIDTYTWARGLKLLLELLLILLLLLLLLLLLDLLLILHALVIVLLHSGIVLLRVEHRLRLLSIKAQEGQGSSGWTVGVLGQTGAWWMHVVHLMVLDACLCGHELELSSRGRWHQGRRWSHLARHLLLLLLQHVCNQRVLVKAGVQRREWHLMAAEVSTIKHRRHWEEVLRGPLNLPHCTEVPREVLLQNNSNVILVRAPIVKDD